MRDTHEINRKAWDERARRGERHTKTVLAKDLRNPLPILDPEGWLEGDTRGKRGLCLAAGGGLHSALLAAAGAAVTVVDISEEMLVLDRQVAREHGLSVTTLQASMDNLAALGDGVFDIVLQPVSTCYVPDIGRVYAEVARVTKPGGVYISQHKQPTSLQAGLAPSAQGYVLTEPYYRAGPLPPIDECLHRESEMVEYLHRWEDLLGGLCRAGFAVEGLVEPRHGNPEAPKGSFGHRSLFIAPYAKIKARRAAAARTEPTVKLWLPG